MENGFEFVKGILESTVESCGQENIETQSQPIISEKEQKKAQEIFVLLVAGNMSLTEINTLTENERMLLSDAFVEKLKQEEKIMKARKR